MKIKPVSFLRILSALGAFFLAASASVSLQAANHTFGALLTHGAGQSSVVDMTENPDGTISLLAQQSGHLSHLGKFTGSFDYLASIDFNTGTTLITGDGVIELSTGSLFVAVHILEVGLDYPRPYTGLLRITGGTGRFAKARGVFEITGLDEESLTDGFTLTGLVLGATAK